MSSERKPEKAAPGKAVRSEHGRFAQTLRRFQARPATTEAAEHAPKGPPPRTASAGTRRPITRSADAVQVPPSPDGRRLVTPESVRAKSAAPASRPKPKPTPPPVPPPSDLDAPEPVQTWTMRWRWTPVIIGAAVLCWIVALSLLFTGSSPMAPHLTSPRLTFVVVWMIASLITFIPLEYRLGLPGLTVQGVAGWTFLGYLLAFAPAPLATGWLLDLPDLPVYLLFFLALFFAISAAALPLAVLGGRRLWAHRLLQLDMRRARRQAYELGILMVGIMVLAGLRALSPLTGFLFVAVLLLIEMLLLSQVAPEG